MTAHRTTLRPEVLDALRAALSLLPPPPSCPRCGLPFGLIQDEEGWWDEVEPCGVSPCLLCTDCCGHEQRQ